MGAVCFFVLTALNTLALIYAGMYNKMILRKGVLLCPTP